MTFIDWAPLTQTVHFTSIKVSYNNETRHVFVKSQLNSLFDIWHANRYGYYVNGMNGFLCHTTHPVQWHFNYLIFSKHVDTSKLSGHNYSILQQKSILWKPASTYFDITLLWSIFASDCFQHKQGPADNTCTVRV